MLQARAATDGVRAAGRGTSSRDFRVVLLHGQKRPREKHEAMRVRGRRGRRARGDHRDRGRHRRRQRDHDAGRGRRPLRHLPAAPAARAHRPRRARVGVPALRAQESPRLRALAEHPTASGSPRSTSSCAGRGDPRHAPVRAAQFRVARLPEDAGCSSRARRPSALAGTRAARARARAARAALQAAYGAEALEPIPASGSSGGAPRRPPPRRAAGRATRPTSDRVREALFAILGPLDGARVLDLFAGCGALGLEALSRGAREATFVDATPARCGGGPTSRRSGRRGEVRRARRPRVPPERARAGRSYDLIFSIPPTGSQPGSGGALGGGPAGARSPAAG